MLCSGTTWFLLRSVTWVSTITEALKPHDSHGFILSWSFWSCPLGTLTPQLKKWLYVFHCLKQLGLSDYDKYLYSKLLSIVSYYKFLYNFHSIKKKWRVLKCGLSMDLQVDIYLSITILLHICHLLMEKHFTFNFPRGDPISAPCILQCDVHMLQSVLGIKQMF